MPHITVQLLEGRTIEQKRATATAITNAMVEHCRRQAGERGGRLRGRPPELLGAGGPAGRRPPGGPLHPPLP